MPGFKVKVLADSVSPDGVRLVTLAYQAPRVILAELNTHRALSRNAESSRAIPFAKKLAVMTTEPYYPDDLPDGPLMGESKGMQARGELIGTQKILGQQRYRELAAHVAKAAQEISDLGFHKENVNRLLEPFSYTRGVISATEMANFFALRCDYRAFPPFRFLARCIWVALSRSKPVTLNWGEWHLPFIKGEDWEEANRRGALLQNDKGDAPGAFRSWRECLLARWSAARCARVSYYQFGTKVTDWDKDTALYERLAAESPMHASPLEHPARCGSSPKFGPTDNGYIGNYRAPWVQLRKLLKGENVTSYQPAAEEVAGWNVPEEVFQGEPGEW